MNQLSIDIADWNFVPFVRRLVRTAWRSPSAIRRGDRVKRPLGMSMALDVSCTRRTQPRAACLFIPLIDEGARRFVTSGSVGEAGLRATDRIQVMYPI